jgi:hypothetical protein
MDMQFRGTITRNSNGSVDILPAPGENAFGIAKLVVHTVGTPSTKDFPVDSDATITITAGVRSVDAKSAPLEPVAKLKK